METGCIEVILFDSRSVKIRKGGVDLGGKELIVKVTSLPLLVIVN